MPRQIRLRPFKPLLFRRVTNLAAPMETGKKDAPASSAGLPHAPEKLRRARTRLPGNSPRPASPGSGHFFFARSCAAAKVPYRLKLSVTFFREVFMEKCSSWLRDREVAAMLGCARSSVWKWSQVRPKFPRPRRRPGRRFTYWLREEVEAYARERGASPRPGGGRA